jgi:hypothetical protein
MPNGNGTYRDELESFARQSGRIPFELRDHECPLELAYLWRWFCELSGVRGSNGWAPNPLTYREIEAWSGLTGSIITAPEVRLLMTIDALYLASAAEASEQRRQWQKQQQGKP